MEIEENKKTQQQTNSQISHSNQNSQKSFNFPQQITFLSNCKDTQPNDSLQNIQDFQNINSVIQKVQDSQTSLQKTRNQVRGILPSKKLTGKGSAQQVSQKQQLMDEQNLLQINPQFNFNVNRSYKKYEELLYAVHLTNKYEWYEKVQTSNRQMPIKMMTGQAFWFLICAQYFQRKLILQDFDLISILKKRINEYQPNIVMRISQQFIQGYKIRQKNILLNNNNKDLESDLLQDQSEIETESDIHLKQILSDNIKQKVFQNQIDLKQQNQTPYKSIVYRSSYGTEDDIYINKMRQSFIKNYKEYILKDNEQLVYQNQQYNDEQYLKALKKIDIDQLINLQYLELQNQETINNQNYEILEEKILQVKNKDRSFPTYSNIDFNDPLIDLQIQSQEEIQYLELLEQIQQQIEHGHDYQLKQENEQQQQQQQQQLQNEGKGLSLINNNSNTNKNYQRKIPKDNNTNINNNGLNNNNNQEDIVEKKQEQQEEIEEEEEEEDFTCQICNDGNSQDEDLIVFCSKCNISVHQRCYGISKIPEEDWVCEMCQVFGHQGQQLKCPLCSCKGGAMKPTRIHIDNIFLKECNPSYYKFNSNQHLPKDFKNKKQKYVQPKDFKLIKKKDADGNVINLYYDYHKLKDKKWTEEESKLEPIPYLMWVHITCIIWTPEVYFEDRNTYNLIKGLDTIDKKRFSLFCSICQTKNKGACVQCPYPKCTEAFHPECARRAHKYLEVKEGEKNQFSIYCDAHIPLKLKRQLEQKERKYKDEIIKFAKSIEKYYDAYLNESRKEMNNVLRIQPKITKKDQALEDKQFLKAICEYVTNTPNKKFTLTLQQIQHTDKYKLLNIQRPKNFNPHAFISKYDDMWYNINFNEMRAEQLYKKYRKILQTKRQDLNKAFDDYFKHKKKEEVVNKKKALQMKQQKLKQQQLQLKIQKIKEKEEQKKKKILEKRNKEYKKLLKKQQKQQQIDQYLYQQKILEEENKLYCLCQQKYVEGDLMMECGQCLDWFHPRCIGFTGTQQQAEDLDFVCQNCDLLDTNENRQARKQYYRPLFIQEDEDYIGENEKQEINNLQKEYEQLNEVIEDDKGYEDEDDDQNQSTSTNKRQNIQQYEQKPRKKIKSEENQSLKSGNNNNQDEEEDNDEDLLNSEINEGGFSDLSDDEEDQENNDQFMEEEEEENQEFYEEFNDDCSQKHEQNKENLQENQIENQKQIEKNDQDIKEEKQQSQQQQNIKNNSQIQKPIKKCNDNNIENIENEKQENQVNKDLQNSKQLELQNKTSSNNNTPNKQLKQITLDKFFKNSNNSESSLNSSFLQSKNQSQKNELQINQQQSSQQKEQEQESINEENNKDIKIHTGSENLDQENQ